MRVGKIKKVWNTELHGETNDGSAKSDVHVTEKQ
jgi:hypothetical protein